MFGLTALIPTGCDFPNGTYDNITASNELQSWLKQEDVQNVDGVTQVISKQPQVKGAIDVIGESPAHWDHPDVPVPGHCD